MTSAARPGEDDLIGRWLRPLATNPAALGLRDDAACLTPPPGHDLVLTKDALAAEVHFFAADPWDQVARKALRTNLSDLAAKGARPLGYLLALGLPDDWTAGQMDALAAGLAADQAEFAIALYGGDTIRSPAGLMLSITAIGAVPTGRMLARTSARPGDAVYVTGTIGDAALGLPLRRARIDGTPPLAWQPPPDLADHLVDRYLLPRPRTALAAWLARHASAGMDVSDGLLIDAGRMAAASGVAITLDLDAVPLSPAVEAALDLDAGCLATALTGGDDYELLFCAPPGLDPAAAPVAVTRIGHVSADTPGLRLTGRRHADFTAIRPGFRHF